jgi:hypothetical protein
VSDQPKSADDCPDDRSADEASIILVSGAPSSWKPAPARQLLLQPQRKDRVFAPVTRYILGYHDAALAAINRLPNQEWEIRTYFLNNDPAFDPSPPRVLLHEQFHKMQLFLPHSSFLLTTRDTNHLPQLSGSHRRVETGKHSVK